jgi:predicted glycoside hydrolase/deacetylase ChbG (UPF0249 family)
VSPRLLIVNADDFGRSEGHNAGVRRAHEEGIVTSASLMVLQPAAQSAAEYARGQPRLSLGLHVDLGDWAFEDGEWRTLYQRAPLDDPHAVEAEVRRQLGRFRELAGREPTHLNAHQHVHRERPARRVFRLIARELGVPLRDFSAIRYCGDFYGQTGRGEPLHELIRAESLIGLIETLPDGATEISCHPGFGLECEVYAREAALEVQTLCDPRVREAVERGGVALVPFADPRVWPRGRG